MKRMNKKQSGEHLPIYGAGPFYGIGIIVLTVIGIVLSIAGVIDSGKVTSIVPLTIMIILGCAFVLGGFLVWKPAALGSKSIDSYIESNKLCTTGIYSIVRNPCYSGIMLACTGVLLIAHNAWLLVLPFVFWLTLTILMKCTEEKWLRDLYGQEYLDYCKKVNRCIPWFPRKK